MKKRTDRIDDGDTVKIIGGPFHGVIARVLRTPQATGDVWTLERLRDNRRIVINPQGYEFYGLEEYSAGGDLFLCPQAASCSVADGDPDTCPHIEPHPWIDGECDYSDCPTCVPATEEDGHGPS